MITARLFNCARCSLQVLLCSTCDRGNVYCGRECSKPARAASLRMAGIRYQCSRQGRLNHALRQQRYRARQKEKVTHQGSLAHTDKAPSHTGAKDIRTRFYCDFCHAPVSCFIRLGYLRRDNFGKTSLSRAKPQAP